jgi:hypothetical protein
LPNGWPLPFPPRFTWEQNLNDAPKLGNLGEVVHFPYKSVAVPAGNLAGANAQKISNEAITENPAVLT